MTPRTQGQNERSDGGSIESRHAGATRRTLSFATGSGLKPPKALRSSGYRSAYHEDTLRLLRRWHYHPAVTEMVPYRVLEP